jgi:TrmH family RNA methyltransferase
MGFSTHTITSLQNLKLKTLLKDDKFLFFEGEKLCRDLIGQRGFITDLIIGLPEILANLPLPYPHQVREVWSVTPQIISKITEMSSPPGLIIATTQKPEKIDFTKSRSVLALMNLQDPGNVGTLIRTACAFGMDGVALIGQSVQLRNRKFLRAVQNALFQIPVSHFEDFLTFSSRCKRNHMALYLTSSSTTQNSLDPEALIPPCALVLGNEGNGFSPDLISQYPTVRIPQSTRVESLNVSVSGGILMHELRKKWGYE